MKNIKGAIAFVGFWIVMGVFGRTYIFDDLTAGEMFYGAIVFFLCSLIFDVMEKEGDA